MSDRASAKLMGRVFTALATEAEQWDADKFEMQRAAKVAWRAMRESGPDFQMYQMLADAALVTLDLAKVEPHAVDGDDRVTYADEKGELP